MVTKEKYKTIRNQKDFLYRYFLEAGGARIPESQFSVLFHTWLLRFGVNTQQSIQQIVNFLDKKFAGS